MGVIYLSFTNFMDSRAEKKAVEAAELGGADFTTSPREAKGKLRPGETEDTWGRDGAKAPAKGSKALAVDASGCQRVGRGEGWPVGGVEPRLCRKAVLFAARAGLELPMVSVGDVDGLAARAVEEDAVVVHVL